MQSVIVYRNPLEAAFWETMMNGGFAIFIAIVLFAIVGVMMYVGIERLVANEWRRCRAINQADRWAGRVPHSFVLWLSRHNGKISITTTIVFAFLMFYYGRL